MLSRPEIMLVGNPLQEQTSIDAKQIKNESIHYNLIVNLTHNHPLFSIIFCKHNFVQSAAISEDPWGPSLLLL